MIIYDLPESQYHADQGEEITLSSSIAKVLWSQTPKHAWLAHPKLNPNYAQVDKPIFDIGTAAHRLFLEGHENNLCIIDASDYRKKDAQEQRDYAYATGMVPLLVKQLEDVRTMANEARWFLSNSQLNGVLDRGKPEVTIKFEYKGAKMRSRLDWLTDDMGIIMDYKTTTDANPESFLRRVADNSHDIQAVTYLEAVKSAGGPEDCNLTWLVQETSPPYMCSLVAPSSAMLEVARAKLDHCIKIWNRCLEQNHWPGYGGTIRYVDPKPWDIAAVEQATMYSS